MSDRPRDALGVEASAPRAATPSPRDGSACPPLRPLVGTTVVAALLAAGALALNGTGPPGWHAAVRITAVFAFPLWLLAFVAGPLARLLPGPWTRALLKRRRALGVSFAAALTVHAGAIGMLARLEPGVMGLDLETIFGGAGIVLALLMAATSSDAAVRALGPRRWRALHRYGQLHLAIIFLATYAGRVAEEDPAWWPGLALVLVALALRIGAFVRTRIGRRRAAPAT